MGAPRQHSCTRARQGIPSSQSWKTRRTSSSHLYCCIVGLMVMDCFLCFFDIHVWLYSWLHKCNSCNIAILLFQSFLCSCSSCMVVQLAAQVQQLRHHHFLLSMSRLGGPRLEGEDTVTRPMVRAPHTIYSRLAPFSVLSYQLCIPP